MRECNLTDAPGSANGGIPGGPRETVGLYYYRLRYYDPASGRFIARDPKGLWGDAANAGNGQAYCGNNPVNSIDPFGLTSWGHHTVPRSVFAGVPDAAADVFNSADALIQHPDYTIHNGKTLNGVTHPQYTDEVAKELDKFLKAKGTTKSKMTAEQAKEFVKLIRKSRNPIIRKFNAGVLKEARDAVNRARAASGLGRVGSWARIGLGVALGLLGAATDCWAMEVAGDFVKMADETDQEIEEMDAEAHAELDEFEEFLDEGAEELERIEQENLERAKAEAERQRLWQGPPVAPNPLPTTSLVPSSAGE